MRGRSTGRVVLLAVLAGATLATSGAAPAQTGGSRVVTARNARPTPHEVGPLLAAQPTRRGLPATSGAWSGIPRPLVEPTTVPGSWQGVDTGQVWPTNAWASGAGDANAATWKTQNFAVHVSLTAPAIASFAPTSGPVGTPVRITGTRFVGVTDVTVGGVSAFPPLPGSTATSLKITVPFGAITGPIAVTSDGGTASSALGFKVTPKLTPWPIAPVQVNDTVDLFGTNLTNDDGTPGVLKLGSAKQTVLDGWTSTDLQFTVPDVVSSKLTISINSGAGTFTTPTNLLIRPTISTVSAGQFTTGSTVTLTGKTFTGTTAVKFAGFSAPVSASSFKVVNATTLTAVVPAAGVSGPVTVTNAGGSTSSSAISIAPKTTAIAPGSGPVGTPVTITGTNFDSTATAMVGGASLTDLQPVSATQLKGRIGDGATTVGGGGNAIVTTAGGTSPSGPVFKVTPNITSVDTSPVRVGDPVVATGTNLDEVTDTGLKIGAVLVPFTHDGPTRLDFHVPGAALTGPLTVTSPQGTTVTSTVLHIRPTLDDLLPPAEGAAGSTVRITGSTLTGTSAVKFTGFDGQESAAATFKVTAGVLTATVPPGAISGSILVTNAGGSTGTTSFTVDPKVTSFTPSSAPAGGGLTITGSGFDSGTTATFTGGQTATQQAGTTETATALKVLVPDGAQTGPIIVDTNSSSMDATTASFKVAPRIDSVLPNPVLVNQDVIVTGLNLNDGTVTVKLGSLKVARKAVVGQTQFSFTVPASAVSAKVTVTTATGTGMSSSILQVTPTVTASSPSSGAAGASVTITGQALGDASAVNFTSTGGTVAAAFTKVTGGIKATVPAAAITGPITVHTGGGSASTGSFLVLPKIASFSPASGPSATTTVTIKGSGFQNGANVAFTGGVSANGTGGGTTLTVKVPPGAATGTISLTNQADSKTTTSTGKFTVSLGITSFTPAVAEPTDDIVIKGVGFTQTSQVFFGGDGNGPGTIAATSTTFNSPTTLTSRAPACSNGRITVKASTASNAPVTWSAANAQMLEVDTISPDTGRTGQVVTIAGRGFQACDVVKYGVLPPDPLPDNRVTITDFQVGDGGTHLTFTVPDGHFDTNQATPITVAPPGDSDPADAKETRYTVNLGIDGVAPPSGPIGNSLTIDGAFPDSDTYTAAFNGTPIPDLSIHGGGRLTATVPFGATSGHITVTDTTPATPITVTSPNTFTVTLRLTPYTGPTGTVVTATGLNFAGIDHVIVGSESVPATPSGNGSSLTFTIPADALMGSVVVTVQPVDPFTGTPLGPPITNPFIVTASAASYYAGPH